MKVVKKVFTSILYIILILIVSYNVYSLVSVKLLHKDLPTVNGYGVLEVVSGSMEPTILVGDLVIIDTNYKKLNENDIITFYDSNNSFVTHRIIEFKEDGIVTRGDNNNSNDQELLTSDKIVGKYVRRLKGLGIFLAALKSPLTMVLILIIGILVCFLVSTDKNGNPILTEEEKEFMEFQEYKKEKIKSQKKQK